MSSRSPTRELGEYHITWDSSIYNRNPQRHLGTYSRLADSYTLTQTPKGLSKKCLEEIEL